MSDPTTTVSTRTTPEHPASTRKGAVCNPRFHSRRLDRRADDPDARGLEHGIERQREAGVPVVQHELHPRPGIFQVHEQVPGLLHDPGLDRVAGGTEDPDAAGAKLDYGQDVESSRR